MDKIKYGILNIIDKNKTNMKDNDYKQIVELLSKIPSDNKDKHYLEIFNEHHKRISSNLINCFESFERNLPTFGGYLLDPYEDRIYEKLKKNVFDAIDNIEFERFKSDIRVKFSHLCRNKRNSRSDLISDINNVYNSYDHYISYKPSINEIQNFLSTLNN